MKWFHHECSAKHDPKLQALGDAFGAEGFGIYWGILEEIGQHSDTFSLKVTGLSTEIDQNFFKLSETPIDSEKISEEFRRTSSNFSRVPIFSVKLLAKVLCTSTRKLQVILPKMVEYRLFDSHKWLKYHMLFSPAFERRADDYTRRSRRSTDLDRTDSEHCSDNVRTMSEHGTNTLRTKSDFVLLEQNKEQKRKRKKTEQNSTEGLPGNPYRQEACCHHSAATPPEQGP